MNGAAAAWVVVLAFLARRSFVAGVYGPRHVPLSWGREMALYAWLVLGALALVAWGLAEARRERINLGVAGFAIVIGCFYFSSVMDKLGRSTSLVGLGLLFLLGGWLLERARRRLLARLESAP